jgi:phage tail-like protein
VVACEPGQDFLRFGLEPGGMSEAAPLTARGYDGLGIVCTPDQRIAYWTASGLRYAVAARLRYIGSASVTAFRLDSGEYQTTWGRLLIDACIPRDTQVRVRCMAADEPPDIGLIAREPPANVTLLAIPHDDQSPPMPAAWMVQAASAALPLHRRAEGPELPWLRRAADDSFETYEAPVHAEPGRYLWVILELTGNTRSTPRIRALRAEFPGHDWLRRIPRTLSSEPQAGAFLQRYLAMPAGALSELDRRAVLRQVLLDAEGAPAEVLPWLASFLGLTLDERWTEAARRRAIREAVWLFRFRGTVPGLSRFIEIVLGVRPIVIESSGCAAAEWWASPSRAARAHPRRRVAGGRVGRHTRRYGPHRRNRGRLRDPRAPLHGDAARAAQRRPDRHGGRSAGRIGRRTRSTTCARWAPACAWAVACISG